MKRSWSGYDSQTYLGTDTLGLVWITLQFSLAKNVHKETKCPKKLWPCRAFCLTLLKNWKISLLPACIRWICYFTVSYVLLWCPLWQIVRYSSKKADDVIILATSHQPLNTFVNFSLNSSLWRVRCTSIIWAISKWLRMTMREGARKSIMPPFQIIICSWKVFVNSQVHVHALSAFTSKFASIICFKIIQYCLFFCTSMVT